MSDEIVRCPNCGRRNRVPAAASGRLQQRFGVQSIPTLLVMREGKVTSRQVGAAPAAALRSWVEQALSA